VKATCLYSSQIENIVSVTYRNTRLINDYTKRLL